MPTPIRQLSCLSLRLDSEQSEIISLIPRKHSGITVSLEKGEVKKECGVSEKLVMNANRMNENAAGSNPLGGGGRYLSSSLLSILAHPTGPRARSQDDRSYRDLTSMTY